MSGLITEVLIGLFSVTCRHSIVEGQCCFDSQDKECTLHVYIKSSHMKQFSQIVQIEVFQKYLSGISLSSVLMGMI